MFLLDKTIDLVGVFFSLNDVDLCKEALKMLFLNLLLLEIALDVENLVF